MTSVIREVPKNLLSFVRSRKCHCDHHYHCRPKALKSVLRKLKMEKRVHKILITSKGTCVPLTVVSSEAAVSTAVVSTNQSPQNPHYYIAPSTKTRYRLTTHTSNNNNIVEVKSYANTAVEHKSPNKVSARTKNEEAIYDLRQRIPEIDKIFDVHNRIGNGTFSTVLMGTLKKDRNLPEVMRRKFAIKHHIPTSHPDRIIKELKCMVEIGGCENVVGVNCTIRHNESVAFIMPYMPHDRFHDFYSKMELGEVQCYMRNLFIALRRVHKFNIIHRDVKPSNFLYNRRKRQFLLVDFGLAQRVPIPQMLTAQNMLEGKRQREEDDASPQNTLLADETQDCPISPDGSVVVCGSVKRLRSNGPQGDQPVYVVANSDPKHKMPLKQLNEISTPPHPTKAGGGSASNANLNSLNSCSNPLSRQIKSTVVGATLANRLQQKAQHATHGGTKSVDASNTPTNSNPTTMAQPAHLANEQVNSDYNPNLSTSNVTKCFCYGNPQVCNICLIKKEIHASRAGTPGYRPPEVLLKYPDQTTAVDMWAAGVIFLSILSSVYPFFKAPNDYVALAEMVTIFGDKTIRKTAFVLDRLVTLSQKTKPLDLRKLCVRFRNRSKFSSPVLLRKYQSADGTCEVCKNCDQFYFNCLCAETDYSTEPFADDDPFPASAYDLLYKLLEVNPHKRLTAEEALEHPFFKEQPKEAQRRASRY